MIRLLNKVFVICFILISVSVTAGNFDRFIKYLNLLPSNERQSKVDSFMNANPIMPLIENDTDAFFIYKGKTLNPKIAGDFTG